MQKCETQTLAVANGDGLKVGIVIGQFNKDVADAMRAACGEQLVNLGVNPDDVTYAEVPGALEIPIILDAMAKTGSFDALIALGSVIRGETYHFEVVSNESARGVMRIQLDAGIPIANGILTCENMNQITERMEQKSKECADLAIDMVRLLDVIYER